MGRHSAPSDDDDRDRDEDRSAVPIAAGRSPKPGRHAGGDEADGAAPEGPDRPGPKPRPNAGLDLIEDVMSGPSTDPAPPVVADDLTVRLPAILDPVLDEPVRAAVTEQLPAVPTEDVGGSAEGAEGATAAGCDEATGKAGDAEAAGAGTDMLGATSVRQPDQRSPKPTRPAGPAPKSASIAASADGTLDPAVGKSRSDLALLRSHADVRARVAAGILVPFLLYVIVLLAVGSVGVRVLLIWIWAPLISAGALGGYFLDAGHRAHDRAASKPPVSE